MASSRDHQERAADCLRLAHQLTDTTNKALLLEMALTWIRLAEQQARKESDENTQD
jgi:hypothetical protein